LFGANVARKRRKIEIDLSSTKRVAQLPITDKTKLPAYYRFVDTPANKQRYFFEPPFDATEIKDESNPNKKFYRLGKKFYGRDCFHIVADGIPLVGEDISKTFARILIKKFSNKELSNSFFSNASSAIHLFFKYLSNLTNRPDRFTDLTQMHFSGWLNAFSDTVAGKRHKDTLQALVTEHPHGKNLNLGRLWVFHKVHNETKAKDLLDFDRLVGEDDYSDQVMFQILAFLCFDLEKIEERFDKLNEMTSESLGDDYFPVGSMNSRNLRLMSLIAGKNDGFNIGVFQVSCRIKLNFMPPALLLFSLDLNLLH
jgi:hypothetical protein